MNAPATTTAPHGIALIVCEGAGDPKRSLGKLQPKHCAHRWRIANGHVTADNATDASAIRNSPCRGCLFGQSRSIEHPTADIPKRVKRGRGRGRLSVPLETQKPLPLCKRASCRKPFAQHARTQEYCTIDCQLADARDRNAAVAAADTKRCEACDEPFTFRHAAEAYCGACRSLPWRRRTRMRDTRVRAAERAAEQARAELAAEQQPRTVERRRPSAPGPMDVETVPAPPPATMLPPTTVPPSQRIPYTYTLAIRMTTDEHAAVDAAFDASGCKSLSDWARPFVLGPLGLAPRAGDGPANAPYVARFGRLRVDCRTLDDLEALLQRFDADQEGTDT